MSHVCNLKFSRATLKKGKRTSEIDSNSALHLTQFVENISTCGTGYVLRAQCPQWLPYWTVQLWILPFMGGLGMPIGWTI